MSEIEKQVSFKGMIKDGEIKRADAMKIMLDDIHEEQGFNLRMEGEDLQASIDALADYIMTGGILPALEVRPRAAGGVWVVDGHRRRRALLLARERGAPVEWVSIVAFTGNDADRVARIITSAEGRALSPLECAKGYKRLAGFGLSPDEIAAKIGKTRSHVDQALLLANANTDVQQMVAKGEVSAATAAKIQRKHGEGSGDVLRSELTKAKASGKGKVTNGTMKPWSPSESLVGPLLKAVESLELGIGEQESDVLNATRNKTASSLVVLVGAAELVELLDAYAAITQARNSATKKRSAKVGNAASATV